MDARPAKPDDANPLPDDGQEGAFLRPYRQLKNDPHRAARAAAWQAENADAMAAYNAWFETEGHKYLRRPTF